MSARRPAPDRPEHAAVALVRISRTETSTAHRKTPILE
jgi:hypothetical protein